MPCYQGTQCQQARSTANRHFPSASSRVRKRCSFPFFSHTGAKELHRVHVTGPASFFSPLFLLQGAFPVLALHIPHWTIYQSNVSWWATFQGLHFTSRRLCMLGWKETAADLADNKATVFSRLTSLKTKLMGNNDLQRNYDQAVWNYVLAGYTEGVIELGESPSGPVYYMPHRGMAHLHGETTRLRVVFVEWSKAPGKLSLNDALFAGPIVGPNL